MIRKGTYILFLKIDSDIDVLVGSIGIVNLSIGEYCYVGSAMNGLNQRILRHMSKDKKIRWHIDYVTSVSEIEAYISYPSPMPECNLAHLVESLGGVIVSKGFGSSDCKCPTHFFRVSDQTKESIIKSANLENFVE